MRFQKTHNDGWTFSVKLVRLGKSPLPVHGLFFPKDMLNDRERTRRSMLGVSVP